MKKKLCLFLFLLSSPLFSQSLQEFRAVKITNVDSDILFDDQRIAEGMDYLASKGINVILTVVWNSHGADGDYTLYPSEVMERYFGRAMHPAFPTQRDPLKRVIIEAHRNGMEVFPWFEMGFSTSYSQNGGHIVQRYPNWALKDNTGKLCVKNGFDWMSAINPEVQKFILALTTEVIDNYDVDGIEYSDRIPAMPVEGGYDQPTVSIYQAEHHGASPPTNFRDANWMRWRADKLSQFYKTARDSIKARGDWIIVSSSPSVYPWSYEEYLQDSKTWLDLDIIDQLIPQLYRTNFSEYLFELNKSLSYVPLSRRDKFFSGMLIYLRGDNYLITPDFLLQSIQANRDRQVLGEAFFFYQGLRLNGNRLGDTLKATYYARPASLPHRHGEIWRPKAVVVNEDDPGAKTFGNWEVATTINGFKPKVLLKKDTSYANICYYFDVPFDAWFDVFAYLVTGPNATDRAPYTIYSETDSTTLLMNQKDFYNKGWQFLKSVYLTHGIKKVLMLDNRDVPVGQLVVADAAMIMINRKLSPDVRITAVSTLQTSREPSLSEFELDQNYPNPFNGITRIRYSIATPERVSLKVFDLLGREVAALVDTYQSPGNYELAFDSAGLASGIYFYRLSLGHRSFSRKLVIIN
ncbi:MAG: family 10 glycosylhydrolase [candidate division KSB1 bacterium]|nr:family 10 glycosylhydrolase [candidate division KSB1 bacterium]MDZ7358756.1 family 10 glycosylhydrolase [candidate division KSB1 bacterium]MDZ7402257.1 family 10 glycosylhydrolase [candidate division KSB1 bacterium]